MPFKPFWHRSLRREFPRQISAFRLPLPEYLDRAGAREKDFVGSQPYFQGMTHGAASPPLLRRRRRRRQPDGGGAEAAAHRAAVAEPADPRSRTGAGGSAP